MHEAIGLARIFDVPFSELAIEVTTLLLLPPNRTDQREGMGLLEYQLMADGCVHLLY